MHININKWCNTGKYTMDVCSLISIKSGNEDHSPHTFSSFLKFLAGSFLCISNLIVEYMARVLMLCLLALVTRLWLFLSSKYSADDRIFSEQPRSTASVPDLDLALSLWNSLYNPARYDCRDEHTSFVDRANEIKARITCVHQVFFYLGRWIDFLITPAISWV